MWMTLFILSALLNVTFVLYARWLLTTIKNISEDLNGISDKITDYVEHVRTLHEVEMFYGEPTLQLLMEHGRDLVTALDGVDLVMNEKTEEEELAEETN
tara:strand:- start:341 stop:637 length:297 start_codon:yes stop_codon:yes gene_type:complete